MADQGDEAGLFAQCKFCVILSSKQNEVMANKVRKVFPNVTLYALLTDVVDS
jgi:hypothetical protein